MLASHDVDGSRMGPRSGAVGALEETVVRGGSGRSRTRQLDSEVARRLAGVSRNSAIPVGCHGQSAGPLAACSRRPTRGRRGQADRPGSDARARERRCRGPPVSRVCALGLRCSSEANPEESSVPSTSGRGHRVSALREYWRDAWACPGSSFDFVRPMYKDLDPRNYEAMAYLLTLDGRDVFERTAAQDAIDELNRVGREFQRNGESGQWDFNSGSSQSRQLDAALVDMSRCDARLVERAPASIYVRRRSDTRIASSPP